MSDSGPGTGVDDAPATDGVEVDPVREGVVDRLQAVLGDGVAEWVVAHGELCVRLDPSSWRAGADHLKSHGFAYFCFLSGIDWMPSAELANRYEQVFTPPAGEGAADEGDDGGGGLDTGLAGGASRFQVFARLYDVDRHLGVTLKADLDDDAPTVDSLVPVFRGADWHEREAWEMYGFDFTGHPGLRHLYLPTEFEGFPMRKDFPLLARVVKPWPGLVDKEPVPGEDDEEAPG